MFTIKVFNKNSVLLVNINQYNIQVTAVTGKRYSDEYNVQVRKTQLTSLVLVKLRYNDIISSYAILFYYNHVVITSQR